MRKLNSQVKVSRRKTAFMLAFLEVEGELRLRLREMILDSAGAESDSAVSKGLEKAADIVFVPKEKEETNETV